jgi:hypothetical protein
MKKQNSIITDNFEECYLCGRSYGLTPHHCMKGTGNRKLADRYKLIVPLCIYCHKELHDNNVGEKHLMKIAQKSFENKYSHELWMKTFRKNHL